jgi:hypothetical protein
MPGAFCNQKNRSPEAMAAAREEYVHFAEEAILPEYRTCSLSHAVRRNFSEEFSELAELLKAAERESGRGGLFGALHPIGGEVTGRGEESICFCLPPTELLLLNPELEFTLIDELYSKPNLREIILAEYPDDYPRLPSSGSSAIQQIDFIIENLPADMVVKLTAPEGGAWNSDWGYRPHDTPMYLWKELGDDFYIVVQELLSPVNTMEPLKEILLPQYQVVDPVGTVQRGKSSLGTGQSGYNRFQQVRCFDYSAVGLIGEDTSKLLRSSRVDSDGVFDRLTFEDRRQQETEQLAHAIFDRSGNRMARQLAALEGIGLFWDSGRNAKLLDIVLDESIDDRVPDSESLESLAVLVAIDESEDSPLEKKIERARDELQAVVAQAIQDRLLRP